MLLVARMNGLTTKTAHCVLFASGKRVKESITGIRAKLSTLIFDAWGPLDHGDNMFRKQKRLRERKAHASARTAWIADVLVFIATRGFNAVIAVLNVDPH